MTWSGTDVIITEIKCSIDVMHMNHPQTHPPTTPSPWKNCLLWNQSLVPKRLGATVSRYMDLPSTDAAKIRGGPGSWDSRYQQHLLLSPTYLFKPLTHQLQTDLKGDKALCVATLTLQCQRWCPSSKPTFSHPCSIYILSYCAPLGLH